MERNTNNKRGLFWRIFDYLKQKDSESAEKKSPFGYRGRQIFFLSLIVGFSAFIGYNLLRFTVIDGDMWRQRANSQQMTSMTIMANRGTIYDANGTVLAQSSTVWNVVIAPTPIYETNEKRRKAYNEELKNKKEGETVEPYRELSDIISTELSKLLGVKPDGMVEACKDHAFSYYYVVKRNVEKPDVLLIKKMMADNNIPNDCIVTEQSSKRYYPNGSLAANVIGFTNFDGDGVYGLEAYYDDYLHGTDGKAFYRTDGLGQGVENENDYIFNATDGYSLVLTLDEVLQHYLEKNLEQCVSQHSVINRACGIIMNCKTGGVLAMATSPSYDLNNPSEITGQYYLDLLEDMKKEGKSEKEIEEQESILREQQWKNKAVTELYYPGSVFKTVTASSALEEEVININSTFFCPGYADVAGTKISCWREWGHDTQTLQQAMTNSCNPSFIAIGQALGMEKFCNYFEAFGFTEPTGIDLPGEAQSLYVPYSRMNLVDLAMSSMGQTNKITPIQMCTAFCAIVNGGKLVTPHLVDKILDSNGNVVETKETQIKRQVISEETSETMRGILETIVTENGGHNAYIAGYRIGGKSGTAEKIDEYNAAGGKAAGAYMTYIGTFAAAVPMDDPQIVMLVLVDTPTGPEYYGSAVACPVVSAVFKDGLEHLGIYPTYTAEEQAKMDAIVPNVRGDLSMYAQSYLTANNFEVRFVGDPSGDSRVTDQVPASGSSIPKGSTVVLYIGDQELEMGDVPNVLNMSVAEANEAITNAGFNIKILGGAAENADAVATMQSYPEGTTLYKGSVIEVTFQANSFGD